MLLQTGIIFKRVTSKIDEEEIKLTAVKILII